MKESVEYTIVTPELIEAILAARSVLGNYIFVVEFLSRVCLVE